MTGASYTLADPLWLLALLALPAFAWWRARRGRPVLVVPFVSQWNGRARVRRTRLSLLLAYAGLALLVLALARPQRVDKQRPGQQQGYDIVLAIDLSGSMLAEDYARDGERINRLQAITPIIDAFIARRPSDRIGIVTFGGRAYTLAPLTADHDWLHRQVARLRVGLIEDGTAVGDALSLAVSRLGQPGRATAGTRLGGFVILLTDGASNAGAVAPREAAGLAAAQGIPVYTVAAGRGGVVPMPVLDDVGRTLGYREAVSDLDEASLRAIADATGGRYFRAADADTVDAAFAAIDRERTISFDATALRRTDELYPWAAWPALALLMSGFALSRVGGLRRASSAPLEGAAPSAPVERGGAGTIQPAPTERRPPGTLSPVGAT